MAANVKPFCINMVQRESVVPYNCFTALYIYKSPETKVKITANHHMVTSAGKGMWFPMSTDIIATI